MEIIRVLDDAGAALDQVIMGHLDIFDDTGLLLELLPTGCYLEWDVFGVEDTSFGKVPVAKIDFLNDDQRLEMMEFVEMAARYSYTALPISIWRTAKPPSSPTTQ